MGLFTKAQPKNLIRVLQAHTGSVKACAVSPDGELIVSAGEDATLKVWDVKSGALRVTLEGHSGPVHACAISGDGSFVVSGGKDGTLRLWDLPSGNVRATLSGHNADAVAVSRDGSVIVSAGGGGKMGIEEAVMFWDVSSGQPRGAPGDHPGCLDCAISPDGSFAVSASFDLGGYRTGNDGSTLKIWDLSSGWVRNTLTGRSPNDTVTKDTHTLFTSCAISSDGSFIASTSAMGTVRIWNAESGEEVRTWRATDKALLMAIALGPDDSLIATGANKVKLWETQTGRVRATFEGHSLKGASASVEDLAVSSDGSFVASAGSDGTVKIWDVAGALAG